MLRSKDYRQKIAFKKTIEDALEIDYGQTAHSKLFASLKSDQDAPEFLSDTFYFDVNALDMMYLQYASEKWISKPCADLFYYVDSNGELVHTDGMNNITGPLIALYKKNWDSIYNAYYESEYAPLENYDMKQKATYNSNEAHSGNDILEMSGKEISKMQGKEYDIKAGQEISKKQGKEFDIKAGQEITKKQGKEFDIKAGKEISKKEGSESTVYDSNTQNLVSAFNSTEYQDANKALHAGADHVTYGKIVADDTSIADERKDTLEFGTGPDERKDTHEFGTGNDERKDIFEFGTGVNARKDTHEFGTGDDERKDIFEFGTGANARKDTHEFGTGADERKDIFEFGTGDDARKDKTTYNSSMAHTGYDELTRHGNIGVTTSQQMLQSEIDLRQYNFIMQVFRDITDYLGLPIY